MLRTTALIVTTAIAAGCGGGTETAASPTAGGTGSASVPDYVPSAVRQEWLRVLSPPSGMTGVLFWGVAIHDTRGAGPSEVLLDWERLVCQVGATAIEVDRNDYTRDAPGGLCLKRPWCADMVASVPVTIDTASGTASFIPSTRPDHVFHWWGRYDYPEGRPAIPPGASRCWVEARVKITGPALIQIGYDWYPSRTGPGGAAGGVIEAAVSHWASASPDWQIVSVGRP